MLRMQPGLHALHLQLVLNFIKQTQHLPCNTFLSYCFHGLRNILPVSASKSL